MAGAAGVQLFQCQIELFAGAHRGFSDGNNMEALASSYVEGGSGASAAWFSVPTKRIRRASIFSSPLISLCVSISIASRSPWNLVGTNFDPILNC
jgi:hypothetical protein